MVGKLRCELVFVRHYRIEGIKISLWLRLHFMLIYFVRNQKEDTTGSIQKIIACRSRSDFSKTTVLRNVINQIKNEKSASIYVEIKNRFWPSLFILKQKPKEHGKTTYIVYVSIIVKSGIFLQFKVNVPIGSSLFQLNI